MARKLFLTAAVFAALSVSLTGCSLPYHKSGPVMASPAPTPSATPSASASPSVSPKPSVSPSASPSKTTKPTPSVTPSKPKPSTVSALSSLRKAFDASKSKAYSVGFNGSHSLTTGAKTSNSVTTIDVFVFDAKQDKGFTTAPSEEVPNLATARLIGFNGALNFKLITVMNLVFADKGAKVTDVSSGYHVAMSNGSKVDVTVSGGVITIVMNNASNLANPYVEVYSSQYVISSAMAKYVKSAVVR